MDTKQPSHSQQLPLRQASKRIVGRGVGNLTAVVLYLGLVSECIFLFECKLWPEPEPGAALAGLGSELRLEIYQA